MVSGSCALPPRWPPQCSCVVIESSFDPGERLQAAGSLWFLWAIVLFVIFSLAHCIVCHFFSGPLYCLSFFYYVFFNLPLRYLQTFLSGAGVGGGVVIFQRHSSNMVCYISSFTKLELTEIVDERCYICLGWWYFTFREKCYNFTCRLIFGLRLLVHVFK